VQAVKDFEGMSFDPLYLREHAFKWDIPEFKKKLIDIVQSEYRRRAN
jgi:hypothetical protein